MAISQDDLYNMRCNSTHDADTLNAQVAQTQKNIDKQTSDQTLYQGMMDKAKADLEDRLTNVKLPYWIGFYPLAVIEYGSNYGTRDIEDWAIKDGPGGTPVYAYTNATVELWHPKWPAALDDNGDDTDANATTYRINVNGLLQNADSIRIKLRAHSARDSVIQSAYIGERTLPYDGTNQDEVTSSDQQFLFNDGETGVTIPAGTEVYSDWLAFNLDMSKEYFISTEHRPDVIYSSINTRVFGVNQDDFQWDGDHASVEVWSGSGTGNVNSRCLSSLEGWDTASGPGWDGDAQLTRNINDWASTKPLIYGKPYGTQAMIKALNTANTTITTRKNQIEARNISLVHFETYIINVTTTGTGSVTPSGSPPGVVTVDYGKDQPFTFSGGTVVKVTVDAADLGVLPSYTFSNVQADHSIRVDFT